MKSAIGTQDRELCDLVADGIRKEFGPYLTSENLRVLDTLDERAERVFDWNVFLGRYHTVSSDCSVRTDMVGGLAVLNPETMQGCFGYVESPSQRTTAYRICHEAIHVLGIRVIEQKQLQPESEVDGVELPWDYIPKVLVRYQCGPIQHAYILCDQESSGEKAVVLSSIWSFPTSAFWEGATDYLAERITRCQTDLNHGYLISDYTWSMPFGLALAAMKLAADQSSTNANVEELMKKALISGNESDLDSLVNTLTTPTVGQALAIVSKRLPYDPLDDLKYMPRTARALREVVIAEPSIQYRLLKDFVHSWGDCNLYRFPNK